MKRFSIQFLIISILFLVTYAKNEDRSRRTTNQAPLFYESKFDGPWVGGIEIATDWGKRSFPFILNLNCQGKTGIGYGRIPTYLDRFPEGQQFFRLKNVDAKNRKLILESALDSYNEMKYIFALKFKKKKGILTGKFIMTPPEGDSLKGNATLYPHLPEKFMQRIWEGGFWYGEIFIAISLQLVQKDVVGGKGNPKKTDISGNGFIGWDFGTLEKGNFNGKKFTGNLVTDNEAWRIKLIKKDHKLAGKLTSQSNSENITLFPVGNNLRPYSIDLIDPVELFAGGSHRIYVLGYDFKYSTVFHIDSPLANLDAIEFAGRENIELLLSLNDSISPGQKLALRMVTPNGEITEIKDAFYVNDRDFPKVSFSAEIQPQLTVSCATSGCHSGGSPKAGLDLSEGASFDNIVGKKSSQRTALLLINPYNYQTSYLINKMKGQNINGKGMPGENGRLDFDRIGMFQNWTQRGAKKD